ncbi:DNA polymerase III subunit chi [Methylobacter sp. BlB1]|jgi:DNA polymerase-3 subunit chi|uniref:DNA polymerase III subunit chi n=1 Tax=unclassified Methylobacter TaxID=2635283 RepID=UPI0018944DDC|nr:DNA polymerase III subunit chi [Methylobacter sp. BlB1]MBF6650615.1 DNA polymerase III subunit chi [Methylobacter sp. BlB1]
MPEVSFYLLPSRSQQERYLFACKLIEKAYRSGHFCYVLTDSAEQSEVMDNLLWTFRAGSFIPHERYTSETFSHPRAEWERHVILIGTQKAPENWQKTVINLSSQCPQDLEQIERILEILDDSEETKEAGRQRYRQYQQLGLAIATHKI